MNELKTKLAKDILVEMSYLLTEDGGRKNPTWSGYRPQFFYNNHDWDAQHEYIDVEKVYPGDTVKAYLTFMSPQEHFGKLKIGDHFLIREGRKIIAFGHVIEIIDLENSAKRIEAMNKKKE